MSIRKARGIVIRESYKGESDKVLTLFCKEIGKITVQAKGARKPKSKYLAGSQLFTYSDFVIYDAGSFQSVTQIDIIQSFYKMREDYDRLCCGSNMLKLLDKILPQGMQCDQLLLLLLKALTALSSGKIQPELVQIIFELKLLEYEGFMPEIDACAVCGCEEFSPLYINADSLLCSECFSGKPNGKYIVKISDIALYAIRTILSAEAELFGFGVSDSILNELQRICNFLTKSHLEV